MSQNFLEEAEKYYNLPLEEAATKVEKFSEAIDLLDATLDNISIDNYEDANDILEKKLKKQEGIWQAQEKAQSKANENRESAEKNVKKKSNLNKKSGIDSDEKKAIQKIIKDNAKAIEEGRYDELEEIDLSMYKANSDGYNAAVKYNEALKAQTKAIQEADLAEQEYLKTDREVAKQKFDNVANYYESKISLLEQEFQDLDNKISEIETSGAKVNKSYYESQKQVNANIKKMYEDEKRDLEEYIKTIPEGTEEWYDAMDQIQKCDDAISDCVKTTMDLNNAINDLYFGQYSDAADDIDRIIKEQEFLQGLFEHEKTADNETGNWTDAGIARLGIASANLELTRGKNATNQLLLDELNSMIANDTLASTNEDFLGLEFNSKDDLLKAQEKINDEIIAGKKEEYAWETKIADLGKERWQAELDMVRKLVDDRIKALELEQDMLSYQNTLNEKVSGIDTLQKQINAYRGDTSAEGMARLQKLQKELSEAEKDLEQTEQEKAFNDQKELLENLFTESEEIITKKMDDFSTLVKKGQEEANGKLSSIDAYLSQVATDFGYEIQEDGTYKLKDGEKSLADSIKTIVKGIQKDNGIDVPGDNKDDNSDENQDLPIKGAGYIKVEQQPKELELPQNTETTRKVTAPVEAEKKTLVLSAKTSSTSKKTTSTGDGKIKVGEKVKFNSGKYTASSDGSGNSGKQNLGKDVYVQKINSGSKRPYLIGTSKSGGVLGWVEKKQLAGFSKGGLVEVDDLNRQIRANHDEALVSVQDGEGFLTKQQTELFQKFVDGGLENLAAFGNIMQPLIKTPDLVPLRNTTFGDTNVVIEMNGVNDVETFSKQLETAIRTPKVQKQLRSVTTDRIGGGSRLGINSIK